jgi:hypothetical protein
MVRWWVLVHFGRVVFDSVWKSSMKAEIEGCLHTKTLAKE